MNNKAPFSIYDASAGSGKTYTLVREFLKIIFTKTNNDYFRKLLAITFTNKAANEMKERILEKIQSIANGKNNDSMYIELLNHTQLSPIELEAKAYDILEKILYNYSGFKILTIDKFTNKILKSFAYDLKIPLKFNIELDIETFMSEAVDQLLYKIGTDDTITYSLIEFAKEKADEDKSWDISMDLLNIAMLSIKEENYIPLKEIENKSSKDFDELKKIIKSKIKNTKNEINILGSNTISLIQKENIPFESFSRLSLPNFFTKAQTNPLELKYNAKWQEEIETIKLYTKSTPEYIKEIIDKIQEEIATNFRKIEVLGNNLNLHQAILNNLNPLSILRLLKIEIDTLKKENNLVLISDFNKLIHNEISNQPTPFIYERLGERYRNFFIDEFQDTSNMQWANIIPLIENTFERNENPYLNGSLLLVGDAKQSIYRWRGGKAEQFIDLTNNTNPFPHIPKIVENLDTNYRSYSEIINFNNNFFSYISKYLNNQDYKNLYLKGNNQKLNKKEGGFVSINFINSDLKEETNLNYCKKTLQIINQLKTEGVKLNDICILTRKKAEGEILTEFLELNDIKIQSNETLALHKSSTIQFIISLLKLNENPNNNKAKITILEYLSIHYKIDLHQLNKKYLTIHNNVFHSVFEKEFNYNSNFLNTFDLYEGIIYIIDVFNLTSSEYIVMFLDTIFNYSSKKNQNIQGFLDYWHKQKYRISLKSSSDTNSVKIMTIHKSKGLEFPIVIYPFAEGNIYHDINSHIWYPLESKEYNGFNLAYLKYNSKLKKFGEIGKYIYEDFREKQELDSINILYVTLTRAKQSLYIISQKSRKEIKQLNINKISNLFISYLKETNQWEEERDSYEIGKSTAIPHYEKDSISNLLIEQKINRNTIHSKENDRIDSEIIHNAKEKGIDIHSILDKIETNQDIEKIISDKKFTPTLKAQYFQLINNIVNHPKLANYFNGNHRILNEQTIITKNSSYRPDRTIFLNNGNVVIIDYKTGKKDKRHKEKIELYKNIYEKMNYKVEHAYLIYISENFDIEIH